MLLSEHMLEINAQAFKDDIMNNYQCLDRSDYSLGILGGAHSEDPVCRPVCCQVRSALAYRSRGGGGQLYMQLGSFSKHIYAVVQIF